MIVSLSRPVRVFQHLVTKVIATSTRTPVRYYRRELLANRRGQDLVNNPFQGIINHAQWCCIHTSNMATQGTSPNEPQIRAKNDLSDMRKPYRDQDDGIEESQLPTRDPIKLFEAWFNMAKESGTVYEPNAFCICTASKDGQPSARMVLLKGFDEEGFRFFTHYSSQKGQNIAENPKVSMLFYWDSFNRQVRVEGTAHRMTEQVAEDYFKRRPQSSQIGAAISDQCSLIESREMLMKKYDDLKAELGEAIPAKPSTWGGYLIKPERFEFWQGNTNRVHDRIMFRRLKDGEQPDGKLTKPAESGWVMERMLP